MIVDFTDGMREHTTPSQSSLTGDLTLKNWVLGTFTAILGICGLFVAARTGFGVPYYGGIAFFCFAVFFVMTLVKVGYDEVAEVSALDEFRAFMGSTFAFLTPEPVRLEQRLIAIRPLSVADLKDVLIKGYEDYREMPTHVVFLIAIYPLVTLIFARLYADYDVLPLVFPLIAGYTLVGPLAATGMYELSRRREAGLGISRRRAFDIFVSSNIRSIAVLGLFLMAVYYCWVLTATAIYNSIFQGIVPESVFDFVQLVFNTPAGMRLMLIGTAAGFICATVVFTLSVVSFPMLLDRHVSIMTAVQTSMRAVVANSVAMGAWGFVIAGTLLLGAIPFFVGLAFVLPMLGHASWHLYRRLVDVQDV